MNVLSQCEIDDDGYKTCAFTIDELFVHSKPYKIITQSPYLVTRTEIEGIYAFLDLGFSGTIEQSEENSHGQWGDAVLDKAIDEAGSHILMIGLSSMKKFPSFLVDYKSNVVVFGAPKPPTAVEAQGARPFRSFESEMFAIEVQLRDLRNREVTVLAFVDTGNPATMIMNKAFDNELSDFGVDSTCGCNVPGLEEVTVQNSNLTLKSHNIDLFMLGHKLNDTLRGVCDISECGSEHTNTTIRNPAVTPAVSLNIGNDSFTKLPYFYIDFQSHRFYIQPKTPVRQQVQDTPETEDEDEESDSWGWLLVKVVSGLAVFLLVMSVLFV